MKNTKIVPFLPPQEVEGHELSEIDHLTQHQKYELIEAWIKESNPNLCFDGEEKEYQLFQYAYLASEPGGYNDCQQYWLEYTVRGDLPYYVERTVLILYLYDLYLHEHLMN